MANSETMLDRANQAAFGIAEAVRSSAFSLKYHGL